MKPLDPRLLRSVRPARNYVFAVAAMGVLASALVLAQTVALSSLISPVITGAVSWSERLKHPMALIILVTVILIRVLAIYVREALGHSAANSIIVELRAQVMNAAHRLGPRWLALHATDTATLCTRGLDNLTPYCVRYLPQLILSATVTPMALAVMLWFDFWSAVIAVGSIPLIPIFMILVGRLTQEFSDRKIAVMERLGSQVLDLLTGVVTMKALGREHGPEQTIRKIGEDYTSSTMATLRLAFLSGAILEFISTLAVALVAVEVGMRLVFGSMELHAGLIVIMLAPEVYNPLRQVGVQFHASADGVAAVNQAFDVIEAADSTIGSQPCPPLQDASLVITNAGVRARGRMSPSSVHATIQPRKITALCGSSGIGKTTLAMAIMGFQSLDEGQITVVSGSERVSIPELDLSSLQRQVTWVPQTPAIIPGTVLSAIVPDSDSVSDALAEAAQATGFAQVVETLPAGWDTRLGHGGVGLSVGQRQRLALTRALVDARPLVILDEPTAHLDALSEEQIITIIKRLRDNGSTVIVIAHRDAVISVADEVVTLTSRALTKADGADEHSAVAVVDETAPSHEIETFFTEGSQG